MEIDEKKLKEVLTEQREEYQRHLDVVVENFSDQIKLLAESLVSTREDLKGEISSAREELKGNIETIREMVAKNTEDITIIRSDIEVIKKNLRLKVDLEDFQALEKRVAVLESKIKWDKT
jgi:dynactin complex subunit